KVKYMGVTAKVRFTVLQSGEIAVLIRDSTLTFSRDTQLNLAEVAVNLYAGQAFMVKKSLNVASTKQLDGATICMITGATLELNIADYGAANNIKINSLLFEKPEEAFAAAEAGRCDGYTDDSGSVAAARSNIADYGAANNIKINSLLFEKPEEAFAAAEAGRCDGYTDDSGSVAAARSTMKKPD